MAGGVRGDILMLGLKVLSLDIAGVADVEGGLPEGATIEVFRFDGRDVTSVSRNLGDTVLLVHCLELVVYFFRDVAA